MHILFLSHYFPPEVNAPASRTFEHARQWVQDPNVQVTVLTNHPNHPNGVLFPGHRNRWFQRETMSGVSVVRVRTLLAANAGFVWRTASFLFFMLAAIVGSLAVRRPDLVVATSPQFFCAVAGYVISRIKRRPFVFELRDLWPESIVAVGAMQSSLVVRMLEAMELFLYRRAAHIVAVTDSFKENLVRRGVPAAKISVLKNGVDLTRFQPRPAPPALRRELGAEERCVVAYIGTVGMAHAIDGIVEAATLMRDEPDVLFLVVGEGAEKARIEAMASARRLSNLRVLPGVDKDRVLDFYALADLNLVTLRAQPVFATVIPSKIFEIMAMSRPILTTVDGECRRIIEAAGAGVFVPPESPAELAEAIRSMVRRPEYRRALGESGRAYVREQFDRRRTAHRYLALLRRLVGDRVVSNLGDSNQGAPEGVPGIRRSVVPKDVLVGAAGRDDLAA